MSHYAYVCLEQNLSRAVALRDKAMWERWMGNLPSYMDRDGLVRYFPNELFDGDDTLTAYVLAIANEAGWEIPESTRKQMIDGLTGFIAGRVVRNSALPTADLAIRKIAAVAALSRYGAARPNMLDSIAIEPNLWPTSAVIDWLGILRNLEKVAQRDTKRRDAEAILRARLNFQGTIMTFSTERSDALWWLMISADSNAVRALIEVLDRSEWREDVPRLVRGGPQPAAERALEHHGCERVGRAGDGEVLCRVRVDAGHWHDCASIRHQVRIGELEAVHAREQRVALPVAGGKTSAIGEPLRHRKSLDDGSSHRGPSLAGAALHRLSHQADRDADRTEAAG